MTARDPLRMVLKHAELEATMGTCDRLYVGCAIFTLDDYRILTMGRNGAPRGEPHCIDVGHLMEDNHCIRAVHGEDNAIIQAARHGISILGAGMALTHTPCYRCTGKIINAGIRAIYFRDWYPDEAACAPQVARLSKAGITLIHLPRKTPAPSEDLQRIVRMVNGLREGCLDEETSAKLYRRALASTAQGGAEPL